MLNPIAEHHLTIHTLIAQERNELSRALQAIAQSAAEDGERVSRGSSPLYDFSSMAKDIIRTRERLMSLEDELRRFSTLVVETAPAAQQEVR